MEQDVSILSKKFFSSYPEQKYSAGAAIVEAYDTPDHIFYIMAGKVRQFDIGGNGTESVLNVYAPGAFFSITWLLTQQENRYYYSALTDTIIRQAPISEVLTFLQKNPNVTMDLLKRLALGIDGLLFRMSAQLQGSITHRLLAEMIIEARRFSKQNTAGHPQINISVNELAARSGMARETASRQIKSLKLRGLIQKEKSVITIPDLSKLENFIGEAIN